MNQLLRHTVPPQTICSTKRKESFRTLNLSPARALKAGTTLACGMATSNSFTALGTVEDIEAVATLTIAETASTSPDSLQYSYEKQLTRSAHKLANPLVWVDLEMTGLDIERDTIIEVACIITDGDLKNEVQGPATAIHADDAVLDSMNDWCKEHHGKSGLTQRVRDSRVSMADAEEALLAFIQEHTQENMAQLAGNSVHVDRMFLLKYMPRVVAYLNYRIVDVSSIKELARRWFPKAYRKAPRKQLAHTALSDIKESIQELKYYRQAVFKNPNQVR